MTDDLKNQQTQDCTDEIRDTVNDVIKLENDLRDVRKRLMNINDAFFNVLEHQEIKK